MGRKEGVTDQQLHDLAEYQVSQQFSDVQRLVLQYADFLTQTPVEVPDSFFDELKKHFSEPQLVELTAAITWENYRARFNHAFGIGSEGFSEGAVCALPAKLQQLK